MNTNVIKIDTISKFHKLKGLKPPENPLISLVDYSLIKHQTNSSKVGWLQNYYTIGLKKNIPGKYRYGQQIFDFDEGLMTFFAPNQILNVEYVKNDLNKKPSGWILLFHPDFIWGTNLFKKINQCEFFNYSLTESLFLSKKEEQIIIDIFKKIENEYQSNIDAFSQNIIVSQIELILNYSKRFYQRQFLTRKKSNHEVLSKLEEILNNYFEDKRYSNQGLPSVKYISETLNLSPNYLSSLLKNLTGLSTQQHIHEKLIEIAKEKLTTTNLTVSEIAYDLGFEHMQSFSKLFKSKTNYSPLKFRASFN